jgi:hypothetical protein
MNIMANKHERMAFFMADRFFGLVTPLYKNDLLYSSPAHPSQGDPFGEIPPYGAKHATRRNFLLDLPFFVRQPTDREGAGGMGPKKISAIDCDLSGLM